MAIAFPCPKCGRELKVKDELAGKRGKCPQCQQILEIPQPAAVGTHEKHAGATLPAVTPAVSQAITAERATPRKSPPAQTPASQQVMAGFRGRFEARPLPLSYRLGVLLTSLFMILLPLIYIGLIAGVIWLVYWHLANNYWLMGAVRGRAVIFAVLAYAAPLIVGGILIAFMIKPLFSWGSSDRRTRSINRESDPLLFAFVDQICETVRSPKPSRIDIDCDINASAHFESALGLIGNRLVLTIGMPLAAALSLQQLAGVLAHEFGHFSQGTGMRLTYVVRTINHWFMRVVYERDAWDEWLVATAGETDLRFGWVLYLAMFFVWLTRKVLWVLMMAGHLVAGFMLRQMEYDADAYEAQLAGSEAFAATARQLQVLGIAWQGAKSDLGDFHREGRLVDNLPKLIMANVAQIPPELRTLVDEHIAKGTTGWFDTHPADKDRIATAAALAAPGVFHSGLPGHVIFCDFDAASRNVTWDFYRGIFGSHLRPQDLSSVDQLLEQQSAETEYNEALKQFFGGRLTALRPLRLPSSQLQAIPDLDAATSRLAACRQAVAQGLPAYRESYTRYDDLDTRLLGVLQVCPLLASEVRVKPAEGRPTLRSRSEAADQRDRLSTELAKLGDKMSDFEYAFGERLYVGLCLLFHPKMSRRIDEVEPLQQETLRMLPVVTTLSSLLDSVLKLRNTQAVLSILFEHYDGNESNASLVREIQDYSERLHTQVRELWEILKRLDYPFDHAKGPLTVGAYLVKTLPPSTEIGQVFEAGDELLSGASSLYVRALARLCRAALAVETALGYEPLPGG